MYTNDIIEFPKITLYVLSPSIHRTILICTITGGNLSAVEKLLVYTLTVPPLVLLCGTPNVYWL